MKLIGFFVFVVLIDCEFSSALFNNYVPFSVSEEEAISNSQKPLVYSRIGSNSNEKGNLLVRMEAQPGREGELYQLRVVVDGKTVFLRRSDNYWFHLSVPTIGDLDNNGLDDLVSGFWPGSQGLSLGSSIIVWSQYEKGRFHETILPGERFREKTDIFDMNGDGIYEIVTGCLVRHDGHHYWVYRIWNLHGPEIINVDTKFGFPRAIWFKISSPTEPDRKLVPNEILDKLIMRYEKNRYRNAIP